MSVGRGLVVVVVAMGCKSFHSSSPESTGGPDAGPDATSGDAAAPLTVEAGGPSIAIDDILVEGKQEIDLTADGDLDWVVWTNRSEHCGPCDNHILALHATVGIELAFDDRPLKWNNGAPPNVTVDGALEASELRDPGSFTFDVEVDPGKSRLAIHWGEYKSDVEVRVALGTVVATKPSTLGGDNHLLTVVHFATAARATATLTLTLGVDRSLTNSGVVSALAATLSRE